MFSDKVETSAGVDWFFPAPLHPKSTTQSEFLPLLFPLLYVIVKLARASIWQSNSRPHKIYLWFWLALGQNPTVCKITSRYFVEVFSKQYLEFQGLSLFLCWIKFWFSPSQICQNKYRWSQSLVYVKEKESPSRIMFITLRYYESL